MENPWLLEWQSSFEHHAYEPVFVGNGFLGGMVDLSGSDADWWSSSIGGRAEGGHEGVLYPVTALRTSILFQSRAWQSRGLLAGRSGIYCTDPRYTSDPAMPHRPQIYDCRQSLDLRTGILHTQGVLYLGSESAYRAGFQPERGVAFKMRLAALKGSPWLALEVEADAEIVFFPQYFPAESFALQGSATGIHKVGNDIACTLQLQQEIFDLAAKDGCIFWKAKPVGGSTYQVHCRGAAKLIQVAGRPALIASGSAFFVSSVSAEVSSGERDSLLEPNALSSADAFFAEQIQRWRTFWQSSSVILPPTESLWQQRYHASLFNVAQSMGPGPTHPGGLSRPMLPYWYGCFHDTDTYFCRALLESGRSELASTHLQFRYRTLDVAKDYAAAAGRSGALYPWQTDSQGKGEPHDVPMNAAIIAVEAWHHFAYARCPEAREQARCIIAAVFHNLADYVCFDQTPLQVRSGTVPTFSETMVIEDPTELRVALRAVAKVWLEVGADEPTLNAWARRILSELELPVDAANSYGLSHHPNDEPAYMRCPSVILGSFPLHVLPADQTLLNTFRKELAGIVYLFAWLPHQASVVASQLQLRSGPLSAASILRTADAFYKPWHAYDEWENRRAVRAANFVTAAGGFATALHHLLLAETEAEVWSLFPGAPDDWYDVCFKDLVTRSGWRVSARREKGEVVEVLAEPVSSYAAPTLTLRWRHSVAGAEDSQELREKVFVS